VVSSDEVETTPVGRLVCDYLRSTSVHLELVGDGTVITVLVTEEVNLTAKNLVRSFQLTDQSSTPAASQTNESLTRSPSYQCLK
jgi:hypothetical protein